MTILFFDDPETEAVVGQWMKEHGYSFKTASRQELKDFVKNHIEGMLEEASEHVVTQGYGHPDNITAYIDWDFNSTADEFAEKILALDGKKIHTIRPEDDEDGERSDSSE